MARVSMFTSQPKVSILFSLLSFPSVSSRAHPRALFLFSLYFLAPDFPFASSISAARAFFLVPFILYFILVRARKHVENISDWISIICLLYHLTTNIRNKTMKKNVTFFSSESLHETRYFSHLFRNIARYEMQINNKWKNIHTTSRKLKIFCMKLCICRELVEHQSNPDLSWNLNVHPVLCVRRKCWNWHMWSNDILVLYTRKPRRFTLFCTRDFERYLQRLSQISEWSSFEDSLNRASRRACTRFTILYLFHVLHLKSEHNPRSRFIGRVCTRKT